MKFSVIIAEMMFLLGYEVPISVWAKRVAHLIVLREKLGEVGWKCLDMVTA